MTTTAETLFATLPDLDAASYWAAYSSMRIAAEDAAAKIERHPDEKYTAYVFADGSALCFSANALSWVERTYRMTLHGSPGVGWLATEPIRADSVEHALDAWEAESTEGAVPGTLTLRAYLDGVQVGERQVECAADPDDTPDEIDADYARGLRDIGSQCASDTAAEQGADVVRALPGEDADWTDQLADETHDRAECERHLAAGFVVEHEGRIYGAGATEAAALADAAEWMDDTRGCTVLPATAAVVAQVLADGFVDGVYSFHTTSGVVALKAE